MTYTAFEDPYCYPRSSVLKNKAGLQVQARLDSFELEMVTLRGLESLPTGNFDPAHYRAVHHHLFQDVYDWAGKYRTVRIAKEGAMFCYPEHIAEQMELLFVTLQTPAFTGQAPADSFVTSAAHFLGDLNAIHPFRDGNGRTQLTLLFLLGERAGFPLDMARIRPAPMMAAMVASFSGKLAPLESEIASLRI